MSRLSKTEVDAYISKYYRSLYGCIFKYCLKRAMEPSEVIAQWYLRLLNTESQAKKERILSKRGLTFFASSYYAEIVCKVKNKHKRPFILIPDYKRVGLSFSTTIEEDIINKNRIEELHKKVKGLMRGAYDANRNKQIEVPNKALQRTFLDIINELPGKGTRQAANQRKTTLIKRLREAYGIKNNSTTDYSRKASPRISSN